MKTALRSAIAYEMKRASDAEAAGDDQQAFAHLERAHILGQRYFLTHMHTHLRMLRLARRRRDRREVRGQVLRLIAVTPGYLSGWVPKGNPGGANVSALKPMPYPDDLAPLLTNYSVWRDVGVRFGLATLAAIVLAVWLQVFSEKPSGGITSDQQAAQAFAQTSAR